MTQITWWCGHSPRPRYSGVWSQVGLRIHCVCVCVCMLSCFSHVWLSVTLGTVACQAPLSMELSREEYWSGLPFPLPENLLNPGIEPLPAAFQADSLLSVPPGKPILDVPQRKAGLPDSCNVKIGISLNHSLSPRLLLSLSGCRTYLPCFSPLLH